MEIQTLDKFCKVGGMSTKRVFNHISRNVTVPCQMEGIKDRIQKIKKYQAQLKKLLEAPGVQQKTPEWYDMRMGMITASDFAQALGDGKFGSVKQFYQKKCEPCDESLASKSNPFFKWGNMFEPVAIAIYSHMFGVDVHEFGLIPHPTKKFFGASPDGISDLGVMVEIKCPKKRKITGEVPMQYFYQIQGQLDVCDLDECDYFESEFDMFHDPQDFWDNYGGSQYQGIIIEKADGSFIYNDIKANKKELQEWDSTIGNVEGIIKKHYWVLMKHNIQRIFRDQEFLVDKFAKLEVVWNNILRYRQNMEDYQKEVINPGNAMAIDIETEPYVSPFASKNTGKGGGAVDGGFKKYAFIDE